MCLAVPSRTFFVQHNAAINFFQPFFCNVMFHVAIIFLVVVVVVAALIHYF